MGYHDSYDDNTYKKVCYCAKCEKKYDEWCKRSKDEKGCWVTKKRCYTVCEFKKVREVKHVEEKGYKVKYEGKWENVDDKKKCHDCQHKNKYY